MVKKFLSVAYKVYMTIAYTAIAVSLSYIAIWLYKVSNWGY